MQIQPIELFSRCQAAFIQKSKLETKIYTLSWSLLIAGGSYLLSSIQAFPLKNIEPHKTAAGVCIVSWLFLSTIAGYYLQDRPKPS